MITWFKKLLSGEIKEIKELEFTEPFVEFRLYPATEDCDVSAFSHFKKMNVKKR